MKRISDWNDVNNIIIENRHGIGDVLHMTWMIIYLRQLFLNARIDMIIPKEAYRQIFNSDGLIDRFYYWDEFDRGKNISKLLSLRKNHYDLGFAAINSTKYLAVTLLKILGCKKIIIEISSNSFLKHLHGVYAVWGDVWSNRILRNVNLLSPIHTVKYNFEDFANWEIPRINRNSVKGLLPDEGRKVALFIGTNPNTIKKRGKKYYIDIKKWGYDNFINLAKKISDEGIIPIILGGRKEYEESRKIIDEKSLGYEDKIINLCGKTTIDQMKGIFLQSDIVVACDTGPMHIAASLGKKVIAIFGPTNPEKYVIPDSDVIVVSKGMNCQYCHDTEKGFQCENIKCLRDISVNEVFDIIMKEIGGRK